MKLGKYLKDKLYSIILFIFVYIIILLLLFAYKSSPELIISLSIILIIFYSLLLLIDFYRKKIFYEELLRNIERLDKKFLILETIKEPSFYEGKLLYNALYDIDKSMNEYVKKYKLNIDNFKEYIEIWIHEVKIPLASLILMTHNHKNTIDKKVMEQIKRIDSYIEQVLFYVRSENAEKDYLISQNKLAKIVSNIALKNKDDLLENKIDFQVENLNKEVLTDSKWLEFILNQIINNSIKYYDSAKDNNYIKLFAEEEDNYIGFNIYDNGIGINKADLSRVFDKSFTGQNGRIYSKATGMGLYIAKKLCDKLGHKIEIESKEKEYTLVKIFFYKDNYYDVLK